VVKVRSGRGGAAMEAEVVVEVGVVMVVVGGWWD